ncbi:hypothetical protein C8Q74DRAFT_795043 [Fomes fomentarius]|nr:hypothetical protein C8Q74DRAFT_795043 [Fomes fomentarius]
MHRIEFAASHHRLSRNSPAMDPVRASDRTTPSKSGRPGSALASPHAVRDSIPADKRSLSSPFCPCPASQHQPSSRHLGCTQVPLLIGPLPFEGTPSTFTGSHAFLHARPFRAPALPDHLCTLMHSIHPLQPEPHRRPSPASPRSPTLSPRSPTASPRSPTTTTSTAPHGPAPHAHTPPQPSFHTPAATVPVRRSPHMHAHTPHAPRYASAPQGHCPQRSAFSLTSPRPPHLLLFPN